MNFGHPLKTCEHLGSEIIKHKTLASVALGVLFEKICALD